MKIIGYCDISNASIEILKKKRKHINAGSFLSMAVWAFLFCCSYYAAIKNLILPSILFIGFSLIFLVLGIGLVIKRELWSIAILIKSNQE